MPMNNSQLTPPPQYVWVNADIAHKIISKYGTPVYAYNEAILKRQAEKMLGFQAPFGLTVRYAMKANPLSAILRLFSQMRIHIDASSGYEAERAIAAGIPASHIMLTSQQLPENLGTLVEQGVIFNATSLHQLDRYGQLFSGTSVSIRINSGLGSGHTKSVSVAGPTSSFGIWHENLSQAITLADSHGLTINQLHSHIGCGANPKVWVAAAKKIIAMLHSLPDVATVNFGGGFKVARLSSEAETDLTEVSMRLSAMLSAFADQTGRRIKAEVEPGTFLVANAGALIARVIDLTSTGPNGYKFIKLDTGMNDLMRPALHGSQHPITILNSAQQTDNYVVVGHNCESTDLLTPDPNNSEEPLPRNLNHPSIGDLVVIDGVGAYCSSMNMSGYNSFPTPNEVLYCADGALALIKRSTNVHDWVSLERAASATTAA